MLLNGHVVTDLDANIFDSNITEGCIVELVISDHIIIHNLLCSMVAKHSKHLEQPKESQSPTDEQVPLSV